MSRNSTHHGHRRPIVAANNDFMTENSASPCQEHAQLESSNETSAPEIRVLRESFNRDNWAPKESVSPSKFRSNKDPGTSSVGEDAFISVTDQESKSTILQRSLSFGISVLFLIVEIVFGIIAVAVLSLDAMWAQDAFGQLHPWAIHLFAFLAICLCVVCWPSLAMFTSFKWPGSCQFCEDAMENSVIRTEDAEQRTHKAQWAKQQFIAYVFHNIRVPFNAIVLGLSHLRSTTDQQASNGEFNDNADIVQMMLDCAETMTSVLDIVKDMGQGEEGNIELNLEEFDLLGAVNFLSWGLKDLLYQRDICFIMNVDPSAKAVLTSNHVVGDKHRVLQTLGSFLSNAIKFSPAGGRLELSIMCEEVFQENAAYLCKSFKNHSCSLCTNACSGERSFAKVLITVNITGIGISVEDQAKLFEPYAFVTSGSTHKFRAAGLSLNLAKRFADQSGGYIGVQSRKGEGSTFCFCLPYPLVPIQHGVDNQLVSKEALHKFMGGFQEDLKNSFVSMKANSKTLQRENSLVSRSPENCYRRKVLLVEDTQINRIVLRRVLQNLNLNCEEAENGQVAVDLLKQGKTYDLILMDKEMPIMDGHEATRQLRMMGVKTPIIALTGNSLQADRDLFFEAGVDDFQTKPLSRDKLVQLLARFGVESS